MITKNDYWDLFYNNNKPLLPSQFATFIANEYLGIKSTVIDVGCGNGRDSLFFMNLGFKVIGIDASKKAIESIQSKLR
jgi:2-polyprenyl-3-methyl-5-hydroxy-6-metoxy-1,4-benzoquinol methylase